jgi:cell division septation protein DedD
MIAFDRATLDPMPSRGSNAEGLTRSETQSTTAPFPYPYRTPDAARTSQKMVNALCAFSHFEREIVNMSAAR